MKNKGESKVLRLPLDDKVLAERFQVVKENTGMHSNRSVLAFLISKAYDKIQESKYRTVFIANEDYDILEKAAKDCGQTVDQYVAEVTLERFEKVKEGVKHAEN